jgi:CheY-like chemotaxis protein
MGKIRQSITIVMADDDDDDRILARAALEESRVLNHVDFVTDGEELMEYLFRRSRYEHLKGTALPGLILLDLNMPRKDGREALRDIKSDQQLRRIPVIILTTSKEEEDIVRSYDLGANSYIHKPVTFEGLVEVMRTIGKYWFEIVEPPQ